MSKMVTGHSLPPHVFPFALGFGVAFGLIPLLCFFFPPTSSSRWTFYLPNPTAFAIGFYLTPNLVLPRVVGAIVVPYVYRKLVRFQGLKSPTSPLPDSDGDKSPTALLPSHDMSPDIRRRGSTTSIPQGYSMPSTSLTKDSDEASVISEGETAYEKHARSVKASLLLIASGLVLGEGTFSILNMIFKATHVPILTCLGCIDDICPPCPS
jgi:hypothetical protein